jgi:hypothetical protein
MKKPNATNKTNARIELLSAAELRAVNGGSIQRNICNYYLEHGMRNTYNILCH